MSLRAAQKQMTYELFLAKALELFGTKGYAATTIDDIATAAGSTRTTFYLHFSSKAEVMSALLTKVDSILTAADDPSQSERVITTHHDSPRYVLGAGRRIRQAPFINHSDVELLLIETLVGRVTPFPLFDEDYGGARRRRY